MSAIAGWPYAGDLAILLALAIVAGSIVAIESRSDSTSLGRIRLATVAAHVLLLVAVISGSRALDAGDPGSAGVPLSLLALATLVVGAFALRRFAVRSHLASTFQDAQSNSAGILALGATVAGTAALVGWLSESALLVQVRAGFAPCQLAAALALTLSGWALSATLADRRAWPRIVMGPISLFAAWAVISDVQGVPLVIDERLLPQSFQGQPVQGGLIPIPTATGMLFAMLGTVFADFEAARSVRWPVVWAAGLVLGVIVAMSLYGFATGDVAFRSWSDGPPMSILATVGLAWLALALLVAGTRERIGPRASLRRRSLAHMPGLAVMLTSVLLWHVLDTQHRAARLQASIGAAGAVGDAVQTYLEVRLRPIRQLARHAEQLDAAQRETALRQLARMILADSAGLVAVSFVSPDGTTTWIESEEDVARFVGSSITFETERARAFAESTASGREAVTGPVLLRTGGLGFVVVFPTRADPGRVGFVTAAIRYETILAHMLRNTAVDFGVALYDGPRQIFQREPVAVAGAEPQAAHANVFGRTWRAQVWPSAQAAGLAANGLPQFVLVCGLGLGGLLTVSLRLAALARARASESEDALSRLRRSETLLVESQRLARIGTWDVDLATRKVSWSDETCMIWGIARDDLEATLARFYDTIHPDDRERHRDAHRRLHREHREIEIEYRIVRPDGEVRFLHERSSALGAGSGKVVSLGGAVRDITEDRRAELELRRAFADLGRQSRQLEALNRVGIASNSGLDARDMLAALLTDMRTTIGAHQAVLSLNAPQGDGHVIHTVALSDKYAAWREYRAQPDGSGIYTIVRERNAPVRMTQEELLAHPRWRGFGAHASAHPPMRGWLAVPLNGRDNENLGMIQLSDRYEDDFTGSDEAVAMQFAQLVVAILERSRLVSDLRRAEAQARDQVEFLEAVNASIADGLFAIDDQARTTLFSPAAERLLGWQAEDVLGRPISDFIAPPDLLAAGTWRLPGQDLIDGGEGSRESEQLLRRRDGSVLLARCQATRLHRDGVRIGVLVAFGDVTALREAQAAHRDRDQLFLLSHELMGIGRGETLMQVNPAFERTLGYPASELTGRSVFRDVHPDDLPRLKDAIGQLRRSGSYSDLALRMRCADGSYRWLEWAASRDPAGVTYAVARDITEKRKAAADLERANAELRDRNEDLQSFAMVASHDLQEPLRKIRSFGELLRDAYAAQLGERGVDYLARMEDAARRMQALIEDLLRLSRVSARAQPFARVDPNAIVRMALSDLEPAIQACGARIDLGDLPEFEADPTQLRQVFQNLIGNALKFHARDRTPVVSVAAEVVEGIAGGNPTMWRLTVADNGVGFDDRHRNRIFMTFQRLHGRNEYPGSGMGLAIVRKIVERHGGTVRAHGVPGSGATFTVELPCAHDRQPGAASVPD